MPSLLRTVRRADPRWWIPAVAITIVVLVLSIVAGHWEHNTTSLSVYDEGAHYDYALRLRTGAIPAIGTKLTQSTLLAESCVNAQSTDPHKCTVKYRAPDFPAGGYSYEAIQPPLGYLPYLLTATPDDSPQVAIWHARHGGIIWAGVAALLATAFAALEEMTLLELAGFLIVCLLCPMAVYSEATITNDSAAVTAGLITLISVRLLRGSRLRWKVAGGLGIGIMIGLMKSLFLFAPFAVVVAVLVEERPWQRTGRSVKELFVRQAAPLALLAGSLVAAEGWILFQESREIVSASVVSNALQGFNTAPVTVPGTLAGVINGLLAQLSLFGPPTGPAWPAYSLWSVGLVGVVVAATFYSGTGRAPTKARGLAVGTVIAMLAMSAYFTVTEYDLGHFNFSAPTRYGLVLIPLVGLVLVNMKRRIPLCVLGIALPLFCLVAQLEWGI